MIKVFTLELSNISSADIDSAINSLPEWRREQALRFKHEQGRKECAFSYLLLCQSIKAEFGIDEQPKFIIGEHGKPTLEGYPHIHFNLSHCKHGISCAVSDNEVGVDIECTGRYREQLARHTMNEEEMQSILSAEDADLAFTRLWTQKEAAFKLIGNGITDDIKNILFMHNIYLCTRENPSSGFVVSVASHHSEKPVFM